MALLPAPAQVSTDGSSPATMPRRPRVYLKDRDASARGALRLAAGSAVMALGAFALYLVSYWSYFEGYISTESAAPPPARTALSVFSPDQTVALVVLAMVAIVGLLGSRWPARLVARSAIVAVPLSALALLVKTSVPPGGGLIVLSGPLPGWSWLLAIPVVWAGAALAWAGLESRAGRWASSVRPWWGPPIEAVWAGVLGTVLIAVVLWPHDWVLVTGSAAVAGLLVTLAGPAWHAVRGSPSG